MSVLDCSDRFARTQTACITNNPKIEVNQYWIAYLDDGSIGRRLRILAPHPDGGWIIAEATGGKLKTGRMVGEPSFCPEFNLRYVFELEKS
jgi:hypothetical protein